MTPVIETEALIDLAPDAILVAERDGRLSFVNDAACRLLGCARDELVGRPVAELVPPAQLDCFRRSSVDPTECELRRKDGSWVPVEARARMLESGQWQGFLRDISERKALAAQIDADRRRLQTILDTMPLGTLILQADGRLFFNRRTEELLGMRLSPTAGSAQYADRIKFPDGSPVPQEQLPTRRVLSEGVSIVAEEYCVERPDGARIPVLGSAAPLFDEHGAVVGVVGVFQDMSERMRGEQAIRANEHLLKSVFDILPVGVWVADASGRLVQTNPAGERIWKGARYVPVEQFGVYKGWWVDTGKPIAAEEWAMARALKGEASLAELVRIQCFDGSLKTILNSAVPLRDERGGITGAIMVNEDITALHETQEQQRASEQLLRTVIELLPVAVDH